MQQAGAKYYVKTLYTKHYTVDNPHYTVDSLNSRLETPYKTLDPAHYTVDTLHYTVDVTHYRTDTLHYTVDTLHLCLAFVSHDSSDSRDSSVSIVTTLWVPFATGARSFSIRHSLQTGNGRSTGVPRISSPRLFPRK